MEIQMKKWREIIWKQTKGNVLEVGVGTGKNIQYYPDRAKITVIDFSEKMLEKAKEKAKLFLKNVDLRLMDVQKLEFPCIVKRVNNTYSVCSEAIPPKTLPLIQMLRPGPGCRRVARPKRLSKTAP